MAFIPETNPAEIELLRAAYAAFNARDIDAVLAFMTPNVARPRAFKGGYVRGPAEVRAYWSEQWSEIDPRVEPTSFVTDEDGRITDDVHLSITNPAAKRRRKSACKRANIRFI